MSAASPANEGVEEEALGKAYDLRLLARLWPYVRPYRREVALTLLLFVPIFLLEAAPAWIVKSGIDRVVAEVLLSARGLPLLVVGTVVGGALAGVTFVVSVISIPMLLDRDINVFAAIATSVVAVRANPAPMALWAAIIVAFTIFGLATLTLGLAIVLPLLGHASWHAYRDLVE